MTENEAIREVLERVRRQPPAAQEAFIDRLDRRIARAHAEGDVHGLPVFQALRRASTSGHTRVLNSRGEVEVEFRGLTAVSEWRTSVPTIPFGRRASGPARPKRKRSQPLRAADRPVLSIRAQPEVRQTIETALRSPFTQGVESVFALFGRQTGSVVELEHAVHVTAASPRPTRTGCSADSAKIKRAYDEQAPFGRTLVGLAHSHPEDDAAPSSTDLATLERFARELNTPFVSVIVTGAATGWKKPSYAAFAVRVDGGGNRVRDRVPDLQMARPWRWDWQLDNDEGDE